MGLPTPDPHKNVHKNKAEKNSDKEDYLIKMSSN